MECVSGNRRQFVDRLDFEAGKVGDRGLLNCLAFRSFVCLCVFLFFCSTVLVCTVIVENILSNMI